MTNSQYLRMMHDKAVEVPWNRYADRNRSKQGQNLKPDVRHSWYSFLASFLTQCEALAKYITLLAPKCHKTKVREWNLIKDIFTFIFLSCQSFTHT
jgi:hypothetical protein